MNLSQVFNSSCQCVFLLVVLCGDPLYVTVSAEHLRVVVLDHGLNLRLETVILVPKPGLQFDVVVG